MKAYIYFLSLLLTFAPVYANAILPALTAVAGSKAGKVVLTRTGGAVLRKISPSALANATKATVGICSKNPLAFAFCTTVVNAIRGDGWDITVNNTTNDIDVEVSKIEKDPTKCNPVFAYANTPIFDKLSLVTGFSAFYTAFLSANSSSSRTFYPHSDMYSVVSSFESIKTDYINAHVSPSNHNRSNWISFENVGNLLLKYKNAGSDTILDGSGGYLYSFYKCTFGSNGIKNYINDYDLNNYVTKNLSDDDVMNIYNYDYSQHTTIKVNNSNESGDDINNSIKNSSDSDTDITENAAEKSKNKNPDYHPDKINDENCSKDEMGRYDKCGADRDSDDTASTPASTPKPTDPPKDDHDDDPPIECNSSGFYKKVCDWMDWTQEEPTEPTDEKPTIKDIDAENSNKIDMDGSCPSPYELNFSIFGYQQNNSISYQPLCNALEMLKPVFVGAGALSSMFILLGYSRQSGGFGGNA